jgi:hypothetical protein
LDNKALVFSFKLQPLSLCAKVEFGRGTNQRAYNMVFILSLIMSLETVGERKNGAFVVASTPIVVDLL